MPQFVSASLFAFALLPARLAPDQVFNLAEALLWFVIATTLAVRACWPGAHRDLLLGAAVTFVFFGFSDWWEIWTHAWYTPWPLLLLNALCLTSLVLHLGLYVRRRRASREARPT